MKTERHTSKSMDIAIMASLFALLVVMGAMNWENVMKMKWNGCPL